MDAMKSFGGVCFLALEDGTTFRGMPLLVNGPLGTANLTLHDACAGRLQTETAACVALEFNLTAARTKRHGELLRFLLDLRTLNSRFIGQIVLQSVSAPSIHELLKVAAGLSLHACLSV